MSARSLIFFAFILMIAADEPANDSKMELNKLQGEWTMVSMEKKGKRFPDEAIKLAVKGDQWTFTPRNGKKSTAIVQMDPSKNPRSIDLAFEVSGKKILSRGIYELKSDTLTLCYTRGNTPRPDQFKTTERGEFLVVWKRQESSSSEQDRSEAVSDDLAWVEEIVLRPNFALKESQTGTLRWTVAPKLSVVGGTRDQQKIVAEVVQHLNETLKRTPLKGIELLGPNNPEATLLVYLVHKQAIPKKATELGQPRKAVQLMAKEKWTCACWIGADSSKKGEIQSAVVLASSDKADAEQLRNNLLTTLCYDLGLMSFSTRRPTSVFYRDGDKRNRAEKLTAKDQQLLFWYYKYVPAGTASVNQLYEDHWKKAMP